MSNIIQFRPKPLSRKEMRYRLFCEMRDQDMKRRQRDASHQKSIMKIHFIGATACLLVGLIPLALVLLGVGP